MTLNAKIITHAILFNIKEVEKSINMIDDCITLMKKASQFKDIHKRLDIYQAKYDTVANALIKEYDASGEDKANYVIVLEELLESIFDLLGEYKKLFEFENPKRDKKFLYDKRTKIKELLHKNEFTLGKFFERYAVSLAFGFMALVNAVGFFKTLLSARDPNDTLSFFILFLIQYALMMTFVIISAVLSSKARTKGRFIRPTAKDKINLYIAVIISLLIPIITFFWGRF